MTTTEAEPQLQTAGARGGGGGRKLTIVDTLEPRDDVRRLIARALWHLIRKRELQDRLRGRHP